MYVCMYVYIYFTAKEIKDELNTRIMNMYFRNKYQLRLLTNTSQYSEDVMKVKYACTTSHDVESSFRKF